MGCPCGHGLDGPGTRFRQLWAQARNVCSSQTPQVAIQRKRILKTMFLDADRKLRNGWWILIFFAFVEVTRFTNRPLTHDPRDLELPQPSSASHVSRSEGAKPVAPADSLSPPPLAPNESRHRHAWRPPPSLLHGSNCVTPVVTLLLPPETFDVGARDSTASLRLLKLPLSVRGALSFTGLEFLQRNLGVRGLRHRQYGGNDCRAQDFPCHRPIPPRVLDNVSSLKGGISPSMLASMNERVTPDGRYSWFAAGYGVGRTLTSRWKSAKL